jgi:hypothetical protein
LPINGKDRSFPATIGQNGDFVIAENSLNLQIIVTIDNASFAPLLSLLHAGEPLWPREQPTDYRFRMNLPHPQGTPEPFGQIPVVASQFMMQLSRQTRGAEYFKGPWRNQHVANKGVDAHEVVHVGMGDKYGLSLFQYPFRQMVNLPAIEQQVAAQGPDPHQQHRIVKQAGAKFRFQVSEQTG